MKYHLFFIIALCLAVTLGCGDKVKLHGKVTFSEDGTPLTKGIVLFETDSFLARGFLDQNGNYTVSSIAKNDGLPPGVYRVSLSKAYNEIGVDPYGMPIIEHLVAENYRKGSTSGLTCDVSKSNSRFDFSVSKDVPAKNNKKKR